MKKIIPELSLRSALLYFADDTKFGQKLMEKMGWSKGKGLGAKEDGKTEHVKVALRTDNRGKVVI